MAILAKRSLKIDLLSLVRYPRYYAQLIIADQLLVFFRPGFCTKKERVGNKYSKSLSKLSKLQSIKSGLALSKASSVFFSKVDQQITIV